MMESLGPASGWESRAPRRGELRLVAEARTDVFDYIERFHNPKKTRKTEHLKKKEVCLTQLSLKKG